MSMGSLRVCPHCGQPAAKVLYYVFPVKWCVAEDCGRVSGAWAFLPQILPFNGYFIRYDRYGPALRRFLTGKVEG